MSDPSEWIEQARDAHHFTASDGRAYWYCCPPAEPCAGARTLDALAAVLNLHRMDTDTAHRWCVADGRTWPCQTVVAITTALGLEGP